MLPKIVLMDGNHGDYTIRYCKVDNRTLPLFLQVYNWKSKDTTFAYLKNSNKNVYMYDVEL